MLRITIDTENDAFGRGSQVSELVRIVRAVADRLEAEQPEGQLYASLRDVNGNTVGDVHYSPAWHTSRD